VRRRTEVDPARLAEILELHPARNEETTRPFRRPGSPLTSSRPEIRPEIKIAGFGGQGILFLGKTLAEAGMRHGYHVSWIPSYGPEMRGGTANCHVILSDDPIGSPLVSHPAVLIALNRPSLDRFEPDLIPGGLLIYDSSLIDRGPLRTDLEVLALPATALAVEAGSARAANMVALGALLGRLGLLNQDGVRTLLGEMTADPARLTTNLRAFEAGFRFAGS
jgi:Pyruvate/2-oxoacid:ferredoxin oxidoreductase gamma subunit